MAELFRKDSLQKLSSTEQLDRMIPMIRPSFWLVLAGAAAALAAGLLWGLLSRLPVCVDAAGNRHPGQRRRNLLCPPGGGQAGTGRHVRHPGGGGEGSPGHLGGALRLLSGGPGSPAGRRGPGRSFLEDGPVVAVECSLDGESALQPGALFSCSIVVEEKAPLAFLLPSLLSAPRGASR